MQQLLTSYSSVELSLLQLQPSEHFHRLAKEDTERRLVRTE
jgi:hypothetical protein